MAGKIVVIKSVAFWAVEVADVSNYKITLGYFVFFHSIIYCVAIVKNYTQKNSL